MKEEEWKRYEAECAEEGGLGRDALVRDWERALRSEQTSSEALFELMKRGVPRVLRPRIWKILSGYTRCREAAEKRGITFDSLKKSTPSPECSKYITQITMDLKRTFPTHRLFLGEKYGGTPKATGNGMNDLFDVLRAYANYDTTIHYCQGMNYLAAMLLMVMGNAEDAFWTFVAVLKNKGTDCFYTPGMPGLVRECDALDDITREKLPSIYKRLKKLDIEPILFVVPWYNPMFTSINNWCIVMRIWDLFMLEGARALRRASLFFLFYSAKKVDKMQFGELLPFLLNPPCRRITVSDFVRSITEGPISDIVAKSFSASVSFPTSISTIASATSHRKNSKGTEKSSSQGFFASIIEENPLARWVKKTLYPEHTITSTSSSSTAVANPTNVMRSTSIRSSRRQRASSKSPRGVTIAGKVEKRRLSSSGNDIHTGGDSLNSSLDGFDTSDIVVAPDQCEDFVTYKGKDFRVTTQNPISPISLESCKLTRKSALKRTHSPPPPPYYHSGYDDVVYFNANTDSDDEISMVTSTSISMDNGREEEEETNKSINCEETNKSISLDDIDKNINNEENNISIDLEKNDKTEPVIGNATPIKKRKTNKDA